ncbi:FadR/GntR family transcriptional regulator [Paenibacillus cymbidii]|uniref:FadR/GntR family transcriptional regulator n=1 Tax=Paenibacillus cymbidii TaxID=1639034 RepID=UPI00108052CB|nr:FadR/GntR family transcriptional regulator [Paenibacillus cymbidii]
MAYNRVQPQKGYELVMQQIRGRIETGDIMPGGKLPSVVDLAQQFGVGRSTIREALSALKAMGLVTIRQGGGTYAVEVLPQEQPADANDLFQTAESLLELLEVRKVLETGCAHLAATKRAAADMAKLEAIVGEMETFLDDEDLGEAADVRFHLQLAASTHNSLLIHLMESLSGRLHDSMKRSRKLWFYGESSTAKRLLQEHRDIVDAIRKGDGALASDKMREHLQKVEDVLRRAQM